MKFIRKNAGILFVFLLLLGGCLTTEKATRYLEKNGELARIAAERYPPKIEYRPGATVVTSDTITVPGDSIPCPPVIQGRDTIIKKVKCPDQKIIRDTLRIRDTAFVEVTARVDYLTRKNIETAGALKAAEGKAKWWKHAALITWGVLLAAFLALVAMAVIRTKTRVI